MFTHLTATYPLSADYSNSKSIWKSRVNLYNIFVNMMKMPGWWFDKLQCVDADHAGPGGT
jgi:hypothetical protein